MMQFTLNGEKMQEVVREMKHNNRCEDANPKGKCQCHCGGALHGLNNMENNGITDERTITERMGGEIEQKIKELKGKTFTCSLNCKQKITVGAWLGYPHEGGLADKDGKKWWIYVECPKCSYDWSWHKIPNEIERERITREQEQKMKQEMKRC
jgi:hypothetical protein